MKNSLTLRRQLVRSLARLESISTNAVRDSFIAVPREVFVPEVEASRGIEAVYSPTDALVVKTDKRGTAISSSSAPSIMAPMLELLDLRPGLRVLEIGAGTGYNAALLKTIVGARGRVTTLDIDPDLAARSRRALREVGIRASVHVGDGAKGWAEGAPYDRIIVTASAGELPRAWFDQLAPDGLLEVPFRLRTSTWGPQIVVTFAKTPNGFVTRSLVPGGFMTMRSQPGADAMSYPTFSVNASAKKPWLTMTVVGDSLDRLSDASRRRLIATMVAKPRTTVVASGQKDGVGGLPLFVALSLPADRAVESMDGWWTAGVIDKSGAGLAVLVPVGLVFNPKGRATVRLVARGVASPERELVRLVRDWRARGRPGWTDLRISASYGGRLSAWRAERRGDAMLGFDWLSADRRGGPPG